MDLNQLKSFVAIVEQGTLSRASAILHVSQPAVSAHIKQLEEELSLTLFDRHAKGMTLTQQGKRIYDHARQVLLGASAIRDEAKRLNGVLSGELVMGIVSGMASAKIPRFLHFMRERAPEVCITIVEETSQRILRKVGSGAYDIGLFEGDVEDSNVVAEVLSPVELVVTYPSSWDGKINAGDANQLFSLPWVGTTEDCSLYQFSQSLFERNGFQFAPTVRVNQEDLLLDLVAQGQGLALMRRETIEKAGVSARIKLLPGFTVRSGLQLIVARRHAKPGLASFARKALLHCWSAD